MTGLLKNTEEGLHPRQKRPEAIFNQTRKAESDRSFFSAGVKGVGLVDTGTREVKPAAMEFAWEDSIKVKRAQEGFG